MRARLVITLAATLWSAAAAAQQAGRTCEYDLECGAGESCNDSGVCVSRGAQANGAETSGDDDCGADRRCRIDRLRRRNAATRHVRTLREERNVRRMLEDEEKQKFQDMPRLKNPFTASLRVSRLGAVGAHVGYAFLGRLQPNFEITYSPDLYVYVPGSGSSGSLRVWWMRGGLAYFLLDSWFSPYVSAGFQVGLGQYYNYFSDFGFGGGGTSGALQSRFHAGEFGGGFDLQFKFGLHTRLGVVYRPLIYNQARIGPGQYDPLSRQGLADWYKAGAAVDVIWLLGWAI